MGRSWRSTPTPSRLAAWGEVTLGKNQLAARAAGGGDAPRGRPSRKDGWPDALGTARILEGTRQVDRPLVAVVGSAPEIDQDRARVEPNPTAGRPGGERARHEAGLEARPMVEPDHAHPPAAEPQELRA